MDKTNTEKNILKEKMENQFGHMELMRLWETRMRSEFLEKLGDYVNMKIKEATQLAQKETAERVKELKETMHKIESEEGDYEDMWNMLFEEIDKIFKDNTKKEAEK